MIKFRPLAEGDWRAVWRNIRLRHTEDTRGIVAYRDGEEEPLAVAVFNSWAPNSVQLHWYIDNPMVIKAGFLSEVYNYAFVTANRGVIIGLVPSDNEDALKLNKHIGMRETYRMPHGYSHDIDYVIMEGTEHDLARWAPEPIKEASNG